jgi:hypothetical protein
VTDHYDSEDGPPNALPPTNPRASEVPIHTRDTMRPPPIDFCGMNDSEKLHWLCQTIHHVSDAQVALQQNIAVLNARVGVFDGEDGGPSLYAKVDQLETALGLMSISTEAMRTHLLGKGASVHDLRRAEEARHSVAPTTDPAHRR